MLIEIDEIEQIKLLELLDNAVEDEKNWWEKDFDQRIKFLENLHLKISRGG